MKRDAFLAQHGDWLIGQGVSNAWRLDINSRSQVVGMLVKQHIFYRYIVFFNFVNIKKIAWLSVKMFKT